MNYSKEFLKEKKKNQWVSKSYINHFQALFNHIKKDKNLNLNKLESFNLKNTILFFQSRSKDWTSEWYNFYRKIYIVFIKYLVREYWIDDFTYKFRAKIQRKRLPKLFENKELKKIFDWIEKEEEKNIILFFLYTWVRKFEFLNLKKADLKNWFINIKNWKWKKERIIPIHDDLQKVINKLSFKYSDKILQKIKKQQKIKQFNWHRLRHTFATNLLRSWAEVVTISELMWHSNLSTTSIYLSLDIKKKKEEINKLKF